MKKKSNCNYFNMTLAAIIIVVSVVVASPTPIEAKVMFSDVKSSDYFNSYVENLSERGIINGFPDGTFKPYEYLTRGQAAKILVGVLELDTKNVANPNFKDVSPTHPYYEAIAALKEAGIINGYEDRTFKSSAFVQRHHMALMISAAFKLKPSGSVSSPFTDVPIGYQNAVTALYEYGVTMGKTATTFGGYSNVTRGQMATFIVRAEGQGLLAPQNFVVESGKQSAKLTWKPVDGASGYNIYRSTSENGIYEKIASHMAETTFLDSDLAYVHPYYYYVQAVNGALEGRGTKSVKIVTNLDQFGPKYTGETIVISNESTDISNLQSSGSWNLSVKLPKGMSEKLYRIHPTPFVRHEGDLKENISTENLQNVQTASLEDKKEFTVYNFSTEEDYKITASLLYDGVYGQVWVHDAALTSGQAAALGTEFDNKIYPLVVNNFGAPSDINEDGKVAILCYDIQDGFTFENLTYIGGYFSPNDLVYSEGSNNMEMFYMDTYPAMLTATSNSDVSNIYSVLAHEFQHMVNFDQDWLAEGNTSNEDTMDIWLNEGLSMAAQHLYRASDMEQRLYDYYWSTSIINGHSLLKWDYSDTISNYALSYLFVQYLRIQAGQGPAIYKEILEHEEGNYKAVESIIQKYIDPTMTFGEFMTAFRIAIIVKADSGLYGFKSEKAFDELITQFYTGQTINLLGGGALIVKPKDGTLTVEGDQGKDVKYTGIMNR